MNAKKIGLVAAVVALIAAFFFFDLGRFLTLDAVKAAQQDFADYYAQNTVTVLAGYFVAYVLIAALSLPGAVPMTLIGGAVFGFWTGLVVISFASTLGATLACMVSRYLLGGWVQNRFGDRLGALNQGLEREGAFYLFTMRLIPIFPFFLINLAMGLTKMPLFTFYWVSQLGMLPGTAVFVNAGTQLATIESAGDILSLRIILSFALLGIFPIAAKKIMGLVRKDKAPAQ